MTRDIPSLIGKGRLNIEQLDAGSYLAKTSYTCKMNDLGQS